MEIEQYVEYIKECRKRGFQDDAIINSLLEKNWPKEEINEAFDVANGKKVVKKKKKQEIKKEKDMGEKIRNEIESHKDIGEVIRKEIDEYQDIGEEIEEIRREIESSDKTIQREKFENSLTIFLDDELKSALEKRAKKNLFTLPEQIEDILRRSTLNLKNKKSVPSEKLDDNLVGLFSRRNTGQKTKKKKAQKKKKKARKEKRAKKKTERKSRRKAKKK
jgi:predicted ribosome quality control (RQC) complex YloA/Tae2 family protein